MVACSKIVLLATGAAALVAPPALQVRQATALAASKQEPHGGKLVNLFGEGLAAADCDTTLQLTERQSCDVELLCNGGFSPLDGFMDEETYKSVVGGMKLPSGLMFSLPVVFDTDSEDLGPGSKILLKQGDLDVATFEVSDKYVPDKPLECLKCYGTSSLEHPGTQMVAMERGKYYLGGKLTGLNKPVREFPCETPEEVRARLPDDVDIVAFQCRNPVHRAHYELFTRALDAPNVGASNACLLYTSPSPRDS